MSSGKAALGRMAEIRNYTMNFGSGRRSARRRIDLTCSRKLAFTATSTLCRAYWFAAACSCVPAHCDLIG